MTANNSRGRVPFGLKGGRLWYVTEVPMGLGCGCVCPDPACGKPLIARNQDFPGRKRIFHFRHASLTTGCGGRESALHRMGKEIVERATSLVLPSWSADELRFDAVQADLMPGGAQEVRLVEYQMRPDVRVGAALKGAYLPTLYVEIKVAHAVDWQKRERVVRNGLTMIEIDLSEVSDEMLQDENAFAHEVLHRAENRRWVHVGNAAFLALMTGSEIVQVTSAQVREKNVRTKSGGTLHLHAQDVLCYSPGSDTPRVIEVELANTFKDSQRIDDFGNSLPYGPGLYRRFGSQRPLSFNHYDFKTHLKAVRQDEPTDSQMTLL